MWPNFNIFGYTTPDVGRYKPKPDPRCEPIQGDEIDEIVNWQLNPDTYQIPRHPAT